MRALALLRHRYRVFAVTSGAHRMAELRNAGAVPLVADLDVPASLRRLASLAPRVLHLAPPPAHGADDTRTRALTCVLRRSSHHAGNPLWPGVRSPRPSAGRLASKVSILPDRQVARPPVLVYASTSGVYGDRRGALVREATRTRPGTDRAVRRVAAERTVRQFGAGAGWRSVIVRIPGIYAATRLPTQRLQRGTPALRSDDDVYTNHIHADDLARIMLAAMARGRSQRIVHASDDSSLRMGDYFDQVADHFGLPRPPRIARSEATDVIAPALLSFMSESRRLDNTRLKRELRVRLRYPTVADFLRTHPRAGG